MPLYSEDDADIGTGVGVYGRVPRGGEAAGGGKGSKARITFGTGAFTGVERHGTKAGAAAAAAAAAAAGGTHASEADLP